MCKNKCVAELILCFSRYIVTIREHVLTRTFSNLDKLSLLLWLSEIHHIFTEHRKIVLVDSFFYSPLRSSAVGSSAIKGLLFSVEKNIIKCGAYFYRKQDFD